MKTLTTLVVLAQYTTMVPAPPIYTPGVIVPVNPVYQQNVPTYVPPQNNYFGNGTYAPPPPPQPSPFGCAWQGNCP